jgi:4-amino-4-deoxy-L-arabinose transferase-like glycosyltransferase
MKKSIVIIIILLLFVVTAFYCFHFFGGYEGIGDGNDYAGLARNIVRGQGFMLGHVYPLSLAFDPNIPQPNDMWAPGYPIYLSVWFSLFGANDHAAVLASVFALWLLIIAGYMLGRRALGDRFGLLVAALIALSQIVLYAAVEGTPEILTGAILTFSVIAILKNQNSLRMILSGLLFALAILTRYQIAIVGVPLAILFIEKKKRLLPIWIAAVLIGITPWLLRNALVLGNPFFTLQSYGEFTKGMGRFNDFYYTYRSFTPMSFFYALSHFPFDLIKKFGAGLIFMCGAFPLRFNFLGIVPFFFALIKINVIDGIQKKILLFSFISSALIIVLSALDGHHDRHMVPLQAFYAVSIFIGFILLAREFKFYERKTVLVILGLLLFLPARAPFQELSLARIARDSRSQISAYSEISQIVKPDEVVISDASDAIWWYADRLSIWIPASYDDFKSLFARDDCRYLYLTHPVDFMNKLRDNDMMNFIVSTEPVTEMGGPGRLFRLKKAPGQ